jgi:hypothetical protein
MLDAPTGAAYLWVNHQLAYPKSLAKQLGREDLDIWPWSVLESHAFRGMRKYLVIDHAAELSCKARIQARIIQAYSRKVAEAA